MPTLALDIESIIVGASSTVPAVGPVRLELASERIAARDLIARAVRQQIDDLTARQRLSYDDALMALRRQYLTAEELEEIAETERIALGQGAPRRVASRYDREVRLDVDREVAKAIEGFAARAYLLLLDGDAVYRLDDELLLTRTTKVMFLRLTPVVGG